LFFDGVDEVDDDARLAPFASVVDSFSSSPAIVFASTTGDGAGDDDDDVSRRYSFHGMSTSAESRVVVVARVDVDVIVFEPRG